MANPVATMTARVQIDKQSVMDEFLKDIKDVQKAADGNAVVYKLKANKDSLKDVLKQMQDSDLQMGVDVVIKAKSKDIQAQIEHLFKETPTINVETKVDTESIKELDNQIDSVSKSIDAAKKKLEQIGKVSSIESIKEEILVADKAIKELEETGKTSGKSYENSVKHVLDMVKTLKDLGGSLPKGVDRRTVQMYQNFLPKYKPQNLVADPSEIKEQENLIESLTNQLAELTAQKEKMAQAGTTGGTGGVADGIAKEGEKLEKAAEEMSEAADKIDKAEQQIEESTTSGSSDKVAESAEETAEAASKEAESFKEAGEAAEKAAEQKEKFANANNEAAQSGEKTERQAEETTSSIEKENKAFKENIDLMQILHDLQGKGAVFNLGSAFNQGLSKEMALAQIDNMAPAIAAAYNEKFGGEFTSKQIANALKAQMKAEEDELQKALSELENKRIEVYKDVDESVFIDQIQQQKKMLAETEEIRAYNESLRADKAMQDAMNLANANAEEEIAREKELARIEKEKIKLSNDWTEALKENARFDKQRAKEAAERAKLPVDIQKELTSLDKVIAKYEQYASVSKEAAEAVQKLKDARTNLKIHSDRDTLSSTTNTRNLNSNILESLVVNKDLVKSSSIDSVSRQITNLGDSILNDTRLFDKFNAEVIQLGDELKKVSTNAGLEQLSSKVKKLTDDINNETKALKQADASQEKINKNAESTAIKELDEWNKRATKSYNELTSQAEKYYDLLKKEENGTISGTELAYLERLKKEWEDATTVVGKYQTAVGSSGGSENNLVNARTKFNESDVAVAIKYAQALSKSAENLRSLASSGKYTSALNSELTGLAKRIDNINKNPIDLKADGTISQLSGIDKELQEVLDKTKVADFRKAVETSIAKLNLKIEKFMQDNTAMGRKFRKQFEDLKLDWDAEHSYAEVQKISKAFIKLEADVEAARATGKSFFDTLRERATGLNAQFLARYFSWEDWIRYTRELAQNVIEVDSAITELRKVSDASNERLQQSFEKSAETAQELGSTISDVIGITSDWARLNNLGLFAW